jgi:hypothetical protein
MNFRRPIQLGVLLFAFVVSGSMAIAQEQGQQVPRMGEGTGMGPGMMQGGMGPGRERFLMQYATNRLMGLHKAG